LLVSAALESRLGPKRLDDFREQLLSARRKLLIEFGAAESDLDAIEDAREVELEARSQGEAAVDVLTRLERRRFSELRDIQAALARIADGSYGTCTHCGARISVGRLRAVPQAALCTECASVSDNSSLAVGSEESDEAAAPRPAVPSELAILDDAEIADLVDERFRAEVGDALSSIRVVCRHGVVTLGGEIGSEELRQVAIRIVEEELDLEVVDRIRVMPMGEVGVAAPLQIGAIPLSGDELLDRALAGSESTEDIFEAEEEGLEYRVPARPIASKY
jgi:RNA polymerase-binding transcription factor DksA